MGTYGSINILTYDNVYCLFLKISATTVAKRDISPATAQILLRKGDSKEDHNAPVDVAQNATTAESLDISPVSAPMLTRVQNATCALASAISLVTALAKKRQMEMFKWRTEENRLFHSISR
mmetsp:Transcript_22887/g.28036  ORF Transcript_22887/g.28036 Transcript_22887/m.28036 type:complete len:121 (-) Transcript_22887:422-784(-)